MKDAHDVGPPSLHCKRGYCMAQHIETCIKCTPCNSELRCRAAIICSASRAAVYKQMVKQMVMRRQP